MIGDIYYFDLYGKLLKKKVTNCGLSQKLRHKLKEVHQKNQFLVCPQKLSKIGPQIQFFFFQKGVDPLRGPQKQNIFLSRSILMKTCTHM